jgi:signal transduction histidine kinase/CheY-like chemotaxis protein
MSDGVVLSLIQNALKIILQDQDQSITELLRLLLDHILETYNYQYGFAGEKLEDVSVYRYRVVRGLNLTQTLQPDAIFSKYFEDGYFDLSESHPMYKNLGRKDLFIENTIFPNLPPGHPPVNNIILLSLKSSNGDSLAVIGLSRKGDEITTYDGDVLERLRVLGGIIIQLALERRELRKNKIGFLANISHELRTPLNGIITMANLLKKGEDMSRSHQYIDILYNCSMQLLEITNDILDYSKIDNDQIKLVKTFTDIKECLDTVYNMIGDRIKSGVSYHCHIDDDVPKTILVDRIRLIQILVNIIGNAIKFTKFGTISISVRCIDEFIEFMITDTGCGIHPNKMEHIFDKINHVSNYLSSECGVGLGLPIARKLTELHGGKLEIISELDKITTVTFTIKSTEMEYHETLRKYYSGSYVLILESCMVNRKIIFDTVNRYGILPIMLPSVSDVYNYMTPVYNEKPLIDFKMCFMDTKSVPLKDIHLLNSALSRVPVVAICEELPCRLTCLYSIRDISADNVTRALAMVYYKSIQINQEKENGPLDARRKRIKILVAEDNVDNQMVLRIMLEGIGYNTEKNVDFVSDGQAMLEELSNKKYHIVLVDLKMPRLNGIDAVKKYNTTINTGTDKPIFIAVTATVSAEVRDICYGVGMSGYITKPIDILDLEKLDQLVMAISDY